MVKLELSEQMIAIIGEALGSHPYRLAAPVIDELQKQINAQQPKTNGSEKPVETNFKEVPKDL